MSTATVKLNQNVKLTFDYITLRKGELVEVLINSLGDFLYTTSEFQYTIFKEQAEIVD